MDFTRLTVEPQILFKKKGQTTLFWRIFYCLWKKSPVPYYLHKQNSITIYRFEYHVKKWKHL